MIYQALPGAGKSYLAEKANIFDTDSVEYDKNRIIKLENRAQIHKTLFEGVETEMGRSFLDQIQEQLDAGKDIVTNYDLSTFFPDAEITRIGFKPGSYLEAIRFRNRTDLLENIPKETLIEWEESYHDADILLEYNEFLSDYVKL